MAKVIIESGDIYNGEYELDLSYFTNRELHILKKETGIRAGELYEALSAADSDLIVALALIAIRRKTGQNADSSGLWDLPAGKITLDVTDEEGDASPPEVALEPSGGAAVSSSDSSVSGESNPEQSDLNSSGSPG